MKRLFSFRSLLPAMAFLVMAGISSTTKADQVLPGTPVAPGGTVPVISTTLTAPINILAVVSTGFSNQFISGTARVAVARESNGFLTFYYQVVSTGGTSFPDDINQINMSPFVGFATAVAQVTNGSLLANGFVDGTIGAPTANRSSAPGSTVNFNFAANTFMPGTTSLVFSIQTNATQFTSGNFSVSDGIVVNNPGFAPSQVPEPSAMILLGSGLLGGVGIFRRRFLARR